MRLDGWTHRLLVSAGAVVGVVALLVATGAGRAASASASAGRAGAVTSEPLPTPTTTSPTTTSIAPQPTTTTTTSTSTSPSTSTSVRPRPVTTAAPTTRPPATTPPPPAPQVTSPPPVAQPTGGTPEERCGAARQWVAEHGLALPAGWGFRCPGAAVVAGAARWGLACWNCAGDGSSWIAIDVGRIGASTAALRYVIAHETCHAIDYVSLGITTEVGADLCAALHGAPRP